MLRFDVITLFPDLIQTYCSWSIISRGIKGGRLAVQAINPRDFCSDRYRKVDDTPYGGGAGMVLKPEPFYAAFDSIDRPPDAAVLLMTPQGERFSQATAQALSHASQITILCGHYEGFDERIRTLATREISLGDYVLTGGEIAALAIIDAIGRLIPGVLGKSGSLAEESFADGLLEGPQYTKPPVFRDMEVPEILRSGDHAAIARWRRDEALKRTLLRRPDMLESASLDERDKKILESLKDNADAG